jgi:hypothetical protein
MTTQFFGPRIRIRQAADTDDVGQAMRLAIANGRRALDLNATHRRRLSPWADVELALERDPTVHRLPFRLRDEVVRALVDYELDQLHGDRLHQADGPR